MAVVNLTSAEIISTGATLRLIFPAASWSTPTVDLSGSYLLMERSGIDIASGFDLYRHILLDSATVLGDGRLQVDAHCTGNDGVTNSARNPIHDGFTNIRLQLAAGAITEGADSNAAESAFSVTATSVATGPVHQTSSRSAPTRNYDITDLATGSPTGMAITVLDTNLARPGVLVAALDPSGLSVPGIDDPYVSGHFEWELLDTSDNPITEYALDSMADPVYGGTVHPYSDYRGPELRCMLYAEETVRVKLTGYWKTSSGEVSASATQDITVRDITWGTDYWVDSVGGNAANDGLDPWGFSLVGATYNTTTRVLTKAGGFTSYDHTAATAATEPWRHYNFIYITDGKFNPSAGTPDEWLDNQVLDDAGVGTDVLNGWTNSGSNGDWTGTGIDTADEQGAVFKNNTGPDIVGATTPAASSVTFGMAFINYSGNNLNDWSGLPGAIMAEQDGTTDRIRIDVYGSTTTETFNATSGDGLIGGFNVHHMVWIRFTEGSGGSGGTLECWVDGTKVELTDGSAKTGTTITLDDDTLASPTGAWRYNVTGGGIHRLGEFVAYTSALTDAQIEEWEGHWAWSSVFALADTGWNSVLASGHTYETAGPLVNNRLFEIESKVDNDSITLAAGTTLNATTGIASSSGPKADGDDTLAGNVRARVKAGSTLSTWVVSSSNVTVGSITPYGSGDNPKFDSLGTLTGIGQRISGGGTLTCDHFVLSQFDLIDCHLQLGWGNSGVGTVFKNQVLHKVRTTQVSNGGNMLNTTPPTGNSSSLVGTNAIGCLIDAAGTVDTEQAFTSEGAKDGSGNDIAADFGFGLVGSYLTNNGVSDTLDHHIYPSGFCDHRFYALGRFGDIGNGSYNVNTTAGGTNGGVTDTPNKYVSFWRQELANADHGIDLSNISNTRIERGGTLNPFESVVIKECSFHDLSLRGMLWYAANDALISHSDFWDIGVQHIFCNDSLTAIVAHNNLHTKEASDSGAIVQLTTTWTDDDTATRKATLKWQEDTIHDKRTQPEVLRCDVTKFTASIANGSDISDVTVYVPNDTSGGAIIYNTATSSYMTVAAFETATGLSDTFTVVAAAPSAPTLSNTTPADGATGVLDTADLVLVFSEDIAYNDGSALIEVYQGGVQVASDQVGNGTINIADKTEYTLTGLLTGLSGAVSIRISGSAFKSLSTGIAYAGISDDTTLDFTIGTASGNRSRDRSRAR